MDTYRGLKTKIEVQRETITQVRTELFKLYHRLADLGAENEAPAPGERAAARRSRTGVAHRRRPLAEIRQGAGELTTSCEISSTLINPMRTNYGTREKRIYH